jgi:uncharacterized protein
MADATTSGDPDLPAGPFSAWLDGVQAAIAGVADSDVPCGDCTGCCTASQFVHVGPDDADALAHIPRELLFPAPGLPHGHLLMGYDERGHCPMLVDGACSIYEHRPRTCRVYDCRVFAAAGIEPEVDGAASDGGIEIARRARRWAFDHPTALDQARHDAVRAAAAFLDGPRAARAGVPVGLGATRRAVLAVEVHDAFLASDAAAGTATVVEPDPEAVRARLPLADAPPRRRLADRAKLRRRGSRRRLAEEQP